MIDWVGDVFTLDNALHALGGAALSAIILYGYWGPWSLSIAVPVILTVFGFLREIAQSGNDWLAPFQSIHKFCEAMAWGVGSALVMWSGLLLWKLS